MMPTFDACRKMLKMFSVVKKYSDLRLKNSQIKPRAISVPSAR